MRIGDDDVLTIPDFAGNLHFNTLGNLLVNPRAGLMFVDFATGDVLQMSGHAEVILESPEIAAFRGAERLWTFRPEKILLREAASPVRWTLCADGGSPSSLMTGDWDEARARLDAARLASRSAVLAGRSLHSMGPPVTVIARSSRDEAIRGRSPELLDCLAPLAMTAQGSPIISLPRRIALGRRNHLAHQTHLRLVDRCRFNDHHQRADRHA